MSEEDRKSLGKVAQTPEESYAKGEDKAERDLHHQIEQYCNQHGWIYFSSRMDKKTRRKKGEPDFIVLLPEGRVLFVECKTAAGILSTAQEDMKRDMESLGHHFHVVRYLEAFIALT
jgi:hypothetical protein